MHNQINTFPEHVLVKTDHIHQFQNKYAEYNFEPLSKNNFDAVQKIGWPEGRIPLAEATVYLATSPKSNSAYLGIDRALELVRQTGNQPVPLPIRNAPTQLMKELGYHDGYLYPHDYPGHFTPQQYMPDALVNERLWIGQHSPVEEKLYERMVNYWGERYK